MDIGTISSDTAAGIGSLSGAGALIAYLAGWRKDSQLDKRLTVIEAHLKKAIDDGANARVELTDRFEKRIDAIENGAIKSASEAAAAIAAATQIIEKRLDQQDAEIASHALMDAQTFVTKAEYGSLKDHMDKQFGELRGLIIDVIKTGPGRARRR